MKDIEKIKKQMAFIQTRFLRFLEIASSADTAFLLSAAVLLFHYCQDVRRIPH